MTASAPQASNTESQASAPKHSAPQTKSKRSRLLTVRLSRFLAAAVAIALVTMLAASAFAMRSWMTSKLDSSLESMLSRLEKNAELTLEQPLPPPPHTMGTMMMTLKPRPRILPVRTQRQHRLIKDLEAFADRDPLTVSCSSSNTTTRWFPVSSNSLTSSNWIRKPSSSCFHCVVTPMGMTSI